MKMIKRFVALTSALVLVASLVIVPVHAEDSLATTGEGWIMPSNGGATAVTPAGIVSISTDFASMLINEIGGGIRDDISSAARWFYSKINEDYCAETENHRHSFVKQHTMVDGIAKNYYVCESCGKSAGEVYDDAYDSYVDDMPVNGIDSSGGFYWYPSFSDLDFTANFPYQFQFEDISGEYVHMTSGNSALPFTYTYGLGFEFNLTDCGNGVSIDYIRAENSSDMPSLKVDSGKFLPIFITPLEGKYTMLEAPYLYIVYKNSSGTDMVKHYHYYSGTVYKLKGEQIRASDFFTTFYSAYSDSGSQTGAYRLAKVHGIGYFPVFRVVPDSAPDSTLYTPDTRPGTITGKYLVQNGDAYEDSSTTIINEDDNSIYNPVTNTTTNYDSWSYDYSTRTYTMTDNTNNSVSTVTYGDENITINEGGNTYNVYYGTVINNNGGDDSGNGGNNGGGTDIDFPSNTGIDTLGERLKVYFQRLPEMMGDINNFLSDAFPYIPQDLMYLIEFSLTISLFMAIIKMIRR